MNTNLFDVEVVLLRTSCDTNISHAKNVLGEYYDFISSIAAGEFREALLLDTIKPLVASFCANDDKSKTFVENVVDAAIQFTQHSQSEDEAAVRQHVLLGLAVCCQQLFVQCNWVGPSARDFSTVPVISDACSQGDTESSLTIDGEGVFSHACGLEYLSIARALLLDARNLLQQCQTAPWWLMRCIQTHQALLEERSPTLKATITELIHTVSKNEKLIASDEYRDLAIQFHLEAGHMCYFYYEPSMADFHFRQAEKISELKVELSGVMGKRTRWQETNVAQLVLSVTRDVTVNNHLNSLPSKSLPNNVPLDDDTVLEEIHLDGSRDEMGGVSLRGVDQAVILGLCHHHRKSSEGQGSIIAEECLAYINFVLRQPSCWCVQASALLQRTHWESDSARRIQRSMMQLEDLVKLVHQERPGACDRLPLVYSVRLPPVWQVERELGNFLMKIGVFNSALEVFLRIKSWEDVIRCYTVLGRREKAEDLIREQLAVKETASLWCYLGDVTQEVKYYEKAWEVSSHHSARAQKSIGFLYLRKQQFEECLPYFEKALEVNALQVTVWFSYGCASLAVEKYDKAAKAFRRCVDLTNDNFEAWSNLASAYIRSGQKPRAFLALQEALKCEYENWRIWENYLVVATDIGEFQEAMRAYNRMLDLRDKFADTEVLRVLVKAVSSDVKDVCGEASSKYRPDLLKLFGRITSKVTSNSDIWRLYSQLVSAEEPVSIDNQQKALQHLQKAHRCSIQTPRWEKDPSQCVNIAKQGSELAIACVRCSEATVEPAQAIQMLASARLMLKGVLAKIKQAHMDPVTKLLHTSVQESCDALERDLNNVSTVLEQKKTS